ncbi:hypothetical protein CC2G_002705 [Coprinopsis cinerea AmutBmut pab1-1]|nr:hypothetical protein CC2G_002705 [Coprinopsis cinerea AmutBmut pab1-1]
MLSASNLGDCKNPSCPDKGACIWYYPSDGNASEDRNCILVVCVCGCPGRMHAQRAAKGPSTEATPEPPQATNHPAPPSGPEIKTAQPQPSTTSSKTSTFPGFTSFSGLNKAYQERLQQQTPVPGFDPGTAARREGLDNLKKTTKKKSNPSTKSNQNPSSKRRASDKEKQHASDVLVLDLSVVLHPHARSLDIVGSVAMPDAIGLSNLFRAGFAAMNVRINSSMDPAAILKVLKEQLPRALSNHPELSLDGVRILIKAGGGQGKYTRMKAYPVVGGDATFADIQGCYVAGAYRGAPNWKNILYLIPAVGTRNFDVDGIEPEEDSSASDDAGTEDDERCSMSSGEQVDKDGRRMEGSHDGSAVVSSSIPKLFRLTVNICRPDSFELW